MCKAQPVELLLKSTTGYNIYMVKKGLIIFFVLVFVFFAFKTNAQIQSANIVLVINPQYPKANENVNAYLSTYSTDLNSARISWTLNGETLLVGIGKKNFSFKVGDSEFQTILEVTIETLDGSTINKRIVISPSEIDMLWEASGAYTPPFYKGKALVPIEGSVKIVAIPSTENQAGLNYKWKKDGKSKQDSSGYEKNYLIYRNTYLEDENKSEVAVSDLFGNSIGYGQISVKPGNPKIVFYRKDLNLGTKWENALSDGFSVNGDGGTIVAEPYFFSTKNNRLSNLDVKWFLNGEQIQTPGIKNTISIKPTSGQYGTSLIKIIINNTATLFQSMEKIVNVNF